MKDQMRAARCPRDELGTYKDPLMEQRIARIGAQVDVDRSRAVGDGICRRARGLCLQGNGFADAGLAEEDKRAILCEFGQRRWSRRMGSMQRAGRIGQEAAVGQVERAGAGNPKALPIVQGLGASDVRAAGRRLGLFHGCTLKQRPVAGTKMIVDDFSTAPSRAAALRSLVPEVDWLDDPETLTYLHSTVSTKRQRVRVPETPMHLDALLTDQPLVGGLEPRLGSAHLRALTVIGFPTATHPGILDELNRLAFPYRWSTRAILLDKMQAVKLLTKIRRQWFAKRKGHRRHLRRATLAVGTSV